MTDKQDWPKTEQRIDAIGQNGATGEHYKYIGDGTLKSMLVRYFTEYPNRLQLTGTAGRFIQMPDGVVWYLCTLGGIALPPARVGNFPLAKDFDSTVVSCSYIFNEIYKLEEKRPEAEVSNISIASEEFRKGFNIGLECGSNSISALKIKKEAEREYFGMTAHDAVMKELNNHIKMRVEPQMNSVEVDKTAKRSHYHVEIKKGVWVDVYDVINGWEVTNPALQHLLKKALKVGKRGHKDTMTDCQDIIDSAIRAKEIEIENADLAVTAPAQTK